MSINKKVKMKGSTVLFAVSIENLKNSKTSYIFEKNFGFFLLFGVSVEMKVTEYLKKKNQMRYKDFLV